MANIRIQDVPQRIQYVATAPTQSVFAIPYPFLVNTDIVVWQDEVELALGGAPGQYGLTGAGTASGGTLTLVTPAAAGVIITITGETPIDRTSIYSPTISNLTSDDLNADLNRIIIMLQEVWTIQNYMMLQYKPWLELSQDIDVTKDRWLPILPPLHGWMMNEANTEIIPVDLSGGGGGGGGDSLIIPITQPAHGFVRDQVVYFDGADYQLAIASNIADAEVIGIVASVTDANNFNLLINGLVETVMALVPGSVYFVSDAVAGLITTVEPTTTGFVSKPLVIANSTSSGVFNNMRGKIINNPEFPWIPVAVNTALTNDKNYFTTGGANLLLTLPPVAAVGSQIKIKGYGSTGWRLVQSPGQTVIFGNQATTAGIPGYLESQNANDGISILCVVANTTFTVLNSVGNFTVI